MNIELLNKLAMPPFVPLRGLANGWRQTVAAHFFPINPIVDNATPHIMSLPDGDKIVVIENFPLIPRTSKRIVVLIHGLTGSHQSKYLIRITRLLLKRGFHVIRMNLRGCGPGKGLASKPYHGGRSDDTRVLLQWLARQYPASPVTQVGFSLGGNLTLKMAGEDGTEPTGNLDSIATISAPLDLYASVKLIISKPNALLNEYFVKRLLKDIKDLPTLFPQINYPKLPSNINLLQFDQLFTAPLSGFKSAIDYYQQCSAQNFINNIHLPTLLLYAKDDPVVPTGKYLCLKAKKNFDVLLTQQGGHVGWLGATDKWGCYHWMDQVLVKWIEWFD